MIIRMSRAEVRAGREQEFRDLIVDAVAGYPAVHEGLLGHQVLSSPDGSTLLYVSRWRDEAALESFAGPGWREQPVMLAGEQDYLTSPLEVTHFEVVSEYDRT